MKRCPQCLFLYPESDERCDFDQTPLEPVDEAEVDKATGPLPGSNRMRRGALPLAVAIGLILGLIGFAVFYGLSQRVSDSVATEAAPTPSPVSSVVPVAVLPSPLPSPSPSPSPSPTPSAKNISTSHARTTVDPVSTSGPGIGSRDGAKPVIALSSGGKIEADEVWRTKDGVWYRRNGIVTLLKRSQVKKIVTR